MDSDSPVEQHSVGRSVLLHLGPGVLIGLCYFALSSVFRQWGLPSIAALSTVALVLVPFELGYLLYEGRKRNGHYSLRGVVLYRVPIPIWQYFVWVPSLFVIVGIIFTLLKPIDAALQQTVFAWMPMLESGLTPDYSRTALIWTYALVAVFGVVVGPVIEEFYFRGFLLPRMGYAGKWAPVLHSLLFAIYHIWTPWQFITRTLGMIPMAYVAQRRNLNVTIIVHVLVNTLDVVTAAIFIAAMAR
ncbi:MAG: type II CAAX endopeptidase family protein [Coriobacteriia bacterium]|nr:type II CAAX endopeptidase family protein [Coriobacteriia bacterium]